MEITSASPFNAIPATVIRGIFLLYTFLTLELYCIVFIFTFISITCVYSFMWQSDTSMMENRLAQSLFPGPSALKNIVTSAGV